MRKVVKPILVLLCVLTAAIILLPALSYLVLHYYLLTPNVLMELVTKEVDERTNLKFTCKEIGLDYLSEWPAVSVVLNQGLITIPAEVEDGQFLEAASIKFQALGGKIDILKLLKEKELVIRNVFLEQAEINANLHYKMVPFVKTVPKKDKQLQYNIDNIRINELNVSVNDSLESVIYHFNKLNLLVSGELNAKNPSFNINELNTSVLIEGDNPFANRELLISIVGHCEATEKFHDIKADGITFLVDQFPFQLEGYVTNIAKNETPSIDLKASLLASDLKELFDFFPVKINKDNYVIKGVTSCNVLLDGEVGKGKIPHVKVDGRISSGRLYRRDLKQGLDTISLAFTMNYNQLLPDSCFVDISQMKLSGMNSRVQIDGHISDFIRNPFAFGDLKGNIDFQRIREELMDSTDIKMKGKVDSDLSFAFNVNDLKQMNFHRLWAEGVLKTENVELSSDKYNFNLYAKGVDMSVGYKKNRSDFIAADEVLSCDAVIDTLNLLYADTISCDVSKLTLRANTVLNNDSNAVTPVTAHMNWEKLRGQMNQFTAMSVLNGELHVGTKPSAQNKNKMEGAFVFRADDTKYMDAKEKLATHVSSANLISEFQPSPNHSGNELTLKNWQVKSQLDFSSATLISSYFPERIDISESRIGIRNNQLVLNRLNINSGNTAMMLSGIITTENDSVSQKSQIDGSLLLVAENIDFDEFSSLFLSGEAMNQSANDSAKGTETIKGLEESLMTNKANSSRKKYPIFIPDNLKLEVQLDIDKAIYEEAELHQVSGDVEIRDRMAHTTLTMRTNLGRAAFNVVYDSRNHNQLYTVFDIDFHDVLLDQLDRVMPSLTSMFPMTKSLDGIADVHLTGQSILDAKMESVLPSAKVAGTFKGQNLTLIDNSTFDEIASKLRFKNKKRNLIDNIEVNFILNESVVEVIPFIIKWDRYKAMAGGTNNLDMMYDYHIDLLESPIPINFGLDLTGKPNDFHYKITLKRKYKELFKDDGVELSRSTAQKMNEVRQSVINRMAQIMK